MLLHILTSVKILQGIGEGKGILGQCIAARRVISVLLIAVKPEKPFRMFLIIAVLSCQLAGTVFQNHTESQQVTGLQKGSALFFGIQLFDQLVLQQRINAAKVCDGLLDRIIMRILRFAKRKNLMQQQSVDAHALQQRKQQDAFQKGSVIVEMVKIVTHQTVVAIMIPGGCCANHERIHTGML